MIHRALELLVASGSLVLLLPLRYLEGQRRKLSLWDTTPLCQVSVLLHWPRFSDYCGTNGNAYAIFTWRKDYTGRPEIDWIT